MRCKLNRAKCNMTRICMHTWLRIKRNSFKILIQINVAIYYIFIHIHVCYMDITCYFREFRVLFVVYSSNERFEYRKIDYASIKRRVMSCVFSDDWNTYSALLSCEKYKHNNVQLDSKKKTLGVDVYKAD